jgi:hypothetical protein
MPVLKTFSFEYKCGKLISGKRRRVSYYQIKLYRKIKWAKWLKKLLFTFLF